MKAIADEEKVIFTCDHDLDGTASAAVLCQAFTEYFGVSGTLLGVVNSHRLTEGYGPDRAGAGKDPRQRCYPDHHCRQGEAATKSGLPAWPLRGGMSLLPITTRSHGRARRSRLAR